MPLFFRKKSPVELAEQLLKEIEEKLLREEKRFQEEASPKKEELEELLVVEKKENATTEVPIQEESKVEETVKEPSSME